MTSSLIFSSGKSSHRLLYHFLFWLAYYAFAVSVSLGIHRIYDWHFYLDLLSLVVPDMALVYLHLYLLLPLLFKRRHVYYVLSLAACIFLHAALTIRMHRMYAEAGTEVYRYIEDFNVANFAAAAINALVLLGLTTGIKLVLDFREREKQHIRTELDLLKSQMHPHFFFNTLNNLYSLTVQKSDLAPEVVLKLSDLLSYMLYESGAARVPLEKEIANLENYMALERLRFGNRISLAFDKEGETLAVLVPPLILLAFVENSFKHGLKDQAGPLHIALSLKVEAGHLAFSISNPAPRASGDTGGIGLKNVTRRLALLYGSRYTLDAGQHADRFHVHLKIPL